MIRPINLDLLVKFVGYAESRASDLQQTADKLTDEAEMANPPNQQLAEWARAARRAAQECHRTVELGRRILERR